MAAGSGVILAGKSLPDSWVRPAVDSVILPAHAQTSPTLYAIGDTGPCGGIVFYISNGGLNGLEAAPSDQVSAQWGCNGTVTGATGTAIGTGAANTATITGLPCGAGSAAQIASNYTGGGCTGWFLPSQDELNELYLQKTVVGDFASDFYWSSSEFNANNAWIQFFDVGFQVGNGKNFSLRVRAVRGF